MRRLFLFIVIGASSACTSLTNPSQLTATHSRDAHAGGSFTYLGEPSEISQAKGYREGLVDAGLQCGNNARAVVKNQTRESLESPAWPAGYPLYDGFPVARMSLLPERHEPIFVRVDFICQNIEPDSGS